MKTILLLIYVLVGFTTISMAQDTIVKKSGTLVICNIQSETADLIKYKNFGHPEGAVYSVWKYQVASIKYQNGTSTEIIQPNVKIDTTLPVKCAGGYMGLRLNQSGRDLKTSEVKELFANNPEALAKYKSGKRLALFGNLIGIPCAAVFGWEFGSAISGQQTSPGLLITGGIGFAMGLIMLYSSKETTKQSIDIYNNQLRHKASARLNLKLTENGVGLCLSF